VFSFNKRLSSSTHKRANYELRIAMHTVVGEMGWHGDTCAPTPYGGTVHSAVVYMNIFLTNPGARPTTNTLEKSAKATQLYGSSPTTLAARQQHQRTATKSSPLHIHADRKVGAMYSPRRQRPVTSKCPHHYLHTATLSKHERASGRPNIGKQKNDANIG